VSKILKRLTKQLSAKGAEHASNLARALLIERGHMRADGTLTEEGKKRDAMGPVGRAKDRAAQASGGKHEASDYVYDSKTNRATLKR